MKVVLDLFGGQRTRPLIAARDLPREGDEGTAPCLDYCGELRLMAAMLLTMLFIGVSMVSSLGNYHRLVAIHRPLGITILILAAIRLANRMFTTLPPFPPTMSRPEQFVATASEKLLYTLFFALPLVGWSMLSAKHYPIVMYGPLHLPPILPANPALYAVLLKRTRFSRFSCS